MSAIHYIVIVTCSLSIVGALFILVSFALFKELRVVKSRHLLFFLSLSDLLIALAYLLPTKPDSNSCEIQALINIFSNQASFLWTNCIALYVFLSHHYDTAFANKFIPFFHVVSWGWPAATAWLVAHNHVWGSDGHTTISWCWIGSNAGWAWNFLAGKAVEWSTLVFISILYVCVYWDMHARVAQSPAMQLHLSKRQVASNWKNTEKKLLAIPAIFLLLRLGGTVRTVLSLMNKPDDNAFLLIMQALGDPGQGFANGLLFGIFTDKVLANYKRLICSRWSGNGHYVVVDDCNTINNP